MKATIVNTVENTTKVVELSNAVNDLAGLKHFLDISDGQFFEGTTHTDLTSDSQSLPELPEAKRERGYVFFVSPAQNKFKNGAYDRKTCYSIIKEQNLGEAVKSEFGRNFTQVATEALNSFIAEHSNGTAPTTKVHTVPTVHTEPTESNDSVTEKELLEDIVSAVSTALALTGKMSPEDMLTLLNKLKKEINSVFPNPYSVQDLANMRK